MTWRMENDGIRGLPKYHRVAPPESWPPNCSQNKTRKKLEVSKNSDRSDKTQHFSVLLKGWTIRNEANKSVMSGRIRWHVMTCQAPDFAETFGPIAKGNSLTCNQKSYMQRRDSEGIGWCGLKQMGTRNKRIVKRYCKDSKPVHHWLIYHQTHKIHRNLHRLSHLTTSALAVLGYCKSTSSYVKRSFTGVQGWPCCTFSLGTAMDKMILRTFYVFLLATFGLSLFEGKKFGTCLQNRFWAKDHKKDQLENPHRPLAADTLEWNKHEHILQG